MLIHFCKKRKENLVNRLQFVHNSHMISYRNYVEDTESKKN